MKHVVLMTTGTQTDGGIPLEEWEAYLSHSPQLKRTAPVRGINPFTRKPAEFKPEPGSAFFDSTSGKCTIQHSHGSIHAWIPDEAAMQIIKRIAADFGATLDEVLVSKISK